MHLPVLVPAVWLETMTRSPIFIGPPATAEEEARLDMDPVGEGVRLRACVLPAGERAVGILEALALRTGGVLEDAVAPAEDTPEEDGVVAAESALVSLEALENTP